MGFGQKYVFDQNNEILDKFKADKHLVPWRLENVKIQILAQTGRNWERSQHMRPRVKTQSLYNIHSNFLYIIDYESYLFNQAQKNVSILSTYIPFQSLFSKQINIYENYTNYSNMIILTSTKFNPYVFYKNLGSKNLWLTSLALTFKYCY